MDYFPPKDNTRMRIVSATTGLLEHTPIEKLRVTDICKASGISRQTFYQYFVDKYDINQWHYNFIANLSIHQIGRTLSWREGIFLMPACILENQNLYRSLATSDDYNAPTKYSKRCTFENILETAKMITHDKVSKKLAFQIRCAADTLTYSARRWILHGMRLPLEEFADYSCSVIPGDLFVLLSNPMGKPEHSFGFILELMAPSVSEDLSHRGI